MKVPTTIQMQRADNAAATLCTVLAYHGRFVPMAEVRAICPSSRSGTPPQLLCDAAHAYGLETEIRKASVDDVRAQHMPVVVQWNKRYYVVVKEFKRGRVAISDPAKGEYEITEEKFSRSYTGTLVIVRPGPSFEKGGHPQRLSELIQNRLSGLKGQLKTILVLDAAIVLLNMAYVEGIRRLLKEGMFDGKPPYVLWAAIAVEAAALLLYTMLAIKKTISVNDASRKSAARSGARLFKRLLGLPMEFFDQVSAGELMQRMENNARIDRTLIQTTIPRVIDVLVALVYLALMYTYNVYVASACLLVEVAYLVATHLHGKAVAVQSRSVTISSGSLSSSILNGMGTIETINAGGTERAFFHMWRDAQADYQERSRQSLRQNAVTQALSGLHNLLSSAALLFVGAYMMMLGKFDVASLAAIQIVVGRLGSELSGCIGTLNSLQVMRTNIERVDDLINRETCPEIPLAEDDDHDKLRGSLVVSHVSYRYNPSDPLVLDDVSFEVPQGQMYAIVGKTGCGKSTLLKLIADLYKPTSGEITYGGRRRDEVADVVFRSSVVTVDQESTVFEDTVSANLRMWDDTVEDYAMILAASDAQIHKRITSESDGYETLMRENGKGFSGGELQRMELARALALEPTFLLLDEFTSALDALTEEKVFGAIRPLDATMVVVAHRLSTICDADQIIVLDGGRIIARGTHEELMGSCEYYRELVAKG